MLWPCHRPAANVQAVDDGRRLRVGEDADAEVGVSFGEAQVVGVAQLCVLRRVQEVHAVLQAVRLLEQRELDGGRKLADGGDIRLHAPRQPAERLRVGYAVAVCVLILSRFVAFHLADYVGRRVRHESCSGPYVLTAMYGDRKK